MNKNYKSNEMVFKNIDDVLSYGIDTTYFSGPDMYCITRDIEHQMWERYTQYDKNGIKTSKGWYDGCVPYKEEGQVVEFQKGEEGTLYDVLNRLATPYWWNREESEISYFSSWKVQIQTDKLSYWLVSKYGMLYIAYVWHDGQVHITNRNWMKNPDWYEMFSYLCNNWYFGGLPEKGITDFYVLLVDREACEPIWDMYEWVTCGLRIQFAERIITVDSKDRAVKTFHCLSNRSHDKAWAFQHGHSVDYPEEVLCRYEKPSNYLCEYYDQLYLDWLELVILPDGSISRLQFDCSDEKGIMELKNYIKSWLENVKTSQSKCAELKEREETI